MLGFSLMVVTYTLPTDNAQKVIVDNPNVINHSYATPSYITTHLDFYTDSIILSEVSYYNKNVSLIDNALSVYGIREESDFQSFVAGNESVIKDYPRYWHGNLVILKPLFLFFDYDSIKILELFFELVMVIGIIKLMSENNLKNYIIPFLFSICLIHPEVIGLSLQFSAMFNIMLVSVYILLRFKEFLFKNNRLYYYFLVVGMATSFFDLSTYPLVSLGVPLIFYMLMNDNQSNLKDNILKIILFGLVWSVGFFGMWLSKLIISTIILDKNIIMNAFKQFIFRTSSVEFTRSDAILNNILVYKKRAYLVIIGCMLIYYVKRAIDSKRFFKKDNFKSLIPFIIIALMPFVWYFLVSNHSYIHSFFTYRELVIFFFAIMCMLEYKLNNENENP